MNWKNFKLFIAILGGIATLAYTGYRFYIDYTTPKDNNPPVIRVQDEIYFEVNDDTAINWEDYVLQLTDNVDDKPFLEINTDGVKLDTVGEYTVSYRAIDSSSNEATDTLKVIVEDTTSPVISRKDLFTSMSFSFEVGVDSIDDIISILKAVDAYDGDVSSSIYINLQPVQLNVVGTYTTQAIALDHSLNVAEQNITINVIDTIAPSISQTDLPTFIEPGSAIPDWSKYFEAIDYCDGNILIDPSDIVTNIQDMNIEGEYTITAYATDRAGNTSSLSISMRIMRVYTLEFEDPIIENEKIVLYPNMSYQLDIDMFVGTISDLIYTNIVDGSNFSSLIVSRNHEASDYTNSITFVDGILTVSNYVPNGMLSTICFEYLGRTVSYEVVIGQDSRTTYYSGFDGGDGSATFPFLISTYEQLDVYMRQNLNLSYELRNNIIVGNAWTTIYWTALGDDGNGSYTAFTGTFDGAGFGVYALAANKVVEVSNNVGYYGFFAKLGNGSLIENLTLNLYYTLDGANTSNSHVIYAGGLAGYADHSTIVNVHISGGVYYNHNPQLGEIVAGGLLGAATYTTISRCSNSAGVIAKRGHNATGGGIIGTGNHNTLTNVINYGNVIVEAWEGLCIIGDCTSVDTNAGGIVGYSSNNTLDFVINKGNVTISAGQDRKQGSLLGYSDSETISANVYYLIGTNNYSIYNQTNSTRGKTEDEFEVISLYISFNSQIWIITNGSPAELDKTLLN